MKAVIRRNYGDHKAISVEEVEKPIPKSKEVLVSVKATTVSRTDCAVLSGTPFIFRFFIGGLFSPKHKVLGTDFAGDVVGVGNEVQNFAIGDRVWGFDDEGLQSQAEFMTIKEDDALFMIPDGVSYENAAASAEGPHYAYNDILKLKIKRGDRIVVNGATGGVGSAAIQILKYFGCYVTAVANTKNMDLIKSYGVDKLYNYEKEDFTKDDEKYNYVFDAVGKSSFGECKQLLNDGGIYVSTELGPGAENIYLPLLTNWSKKKVKFPLPTNRRRSLLFMNRLLKEGKYKPVIDKTYAMEDVAQAYEYAGKGLKTGNVIIKIN